jgi:hypothetical protein
VVIDSLTRLDQRFLLGFQRGKDRVRVGSLGIARFVKTVGTGQNVLIALREAYKSRRQVAFDQARDLPPEVGRENTVVGSARSRSAIAFVGCQRPLELCASALLVTKPRKRLLKRQEGVCDRATSGPERRKNFSHRAPNGSFKPGSTQIPTSAVEPKIAGVEHLGLNRERVTFTSQPTPAGFMVDVKAGSRLTFVFHDVSLYELLNYPLAKHCMRETPGFQGPPSGPWLQSN